MCFQIIGNRKLFALLARTAVADARGLPDGYTSLRYYLRLGYSCCACWLIDLRMLAEVDMLPEIQVVTPQHNLGRFDGQFLVQTRSRLLVLATSTSFSASIGHDYENGSFTASTEITTPGADGKARVCKTVLLAHRDLLP